MASKFNQDRDGLYDEGGYWDWADDADEGAWGLVSDDEPGVTIPEVSNHDKAVFATAIGLLGLGVALGTGVTVRHVKRRNKGEQN